MSPVQAPVSNEHCHKPACQRAACFVRMINTVYACSPSVGVDTARPKMTLPIWKNGASQSPR